MLDGLPFSSPLRQGRSRSLIETLPSGRIDWMSHVTSTCFFASTAGLRKKIKIVNLLPRSTLSAVLKRGIVSGEVSHFSLQSASGVTMTHPPKPSFDFRNSVSGAGRPCSSFQTDSLVGGPVGAAHRPDIAVAMIMKQQIKRLAATDVSELFVIS